jgi:FkbM family methyltransferase
MPVNIRQSVQTLFNRLGWEVRRTSYPTSEEAVLRRFLVAIRPGAVLDVGANVGQYGTSLRKCGFEGRIVSFEALPDAHARLCRTAATDGNWIAAPCCALGREPAETLIHVARNSVSSSLLPMTDTHLQAAPESRLQGTQRVRVERLDAMAPALLSGDERILLKIDTQGYEEEVLAGASAIMGRVAALQLELSLVPLYAGAPSLRHLLDVCAGLGFELHGLIPGFYDPRQGRLLQMDGLFSRIRSG